MARGGLSVFLPWSLDALLPEAEEGCAPRTTEVGAVLFCDVAGFTPLTEALSVLGREGAEELTRLLNGYFTRMIGILDEEGGDVLRFGGDAMTVFFPGDSRERAARGALRMMETMAEFEGLPTRAGAFSLSMKIGAAYGPVHLGLLGSPDLGWDYYAAGRPLDDAADAEHHAVPGRIVLHPTFLEALPEALRAEPIGEGYARLSAVVGEPPPALVPPSAPEEALLRGLVPPHLAERAGQGCLGEHRATAVVFLSIAGLAWEDPAATHEALRGLYAHFARTARRYGGSLNKLDFGDKGAKGLFLFGAPHACERKEEMAARAALDLLAPPEGAALRLKAGVTSAPLFSGPVGSPSRREFTVMGDGINLSARLMAACAEGEALASREVAEGAGGALRFQILPPITVKGKRAPVAIFSPRGERSDAGGDTGLLLEREAAQEALRAALFGAGGAAPLCEAEPGMGKSALAAWALRESRAREIPAVWVPLAPFGAERAFGAFRALTRIAVGAEKGDAPERVAALREAALSGEEPGHRPVLNPLLGLPEEVTPALKGLSPKERKELTFAVVKRLLDGGGERVVLLDGLQWADPLSLDLLSFLVRESGGAPWRLALFARPGGAPDGLRSATSALPLPPLTAAGTRALLEEGHQISGLTETGLRWFAEKARGNPALAQALVRSLGEAGLLREEAEGRRRLDEDRLHTTAFPDTLEGLFLRRVDALDPTERLVLQEASALGYSVSLNLLERITSVGKAACAAALQTLHGAGLLRGDTRGDRPYASFAESLLRDAVYGAIPFGLRRPIHLRALEALLEMEGEATPRLWPTFAHHAEQGGDEDRARRFHRLAGREALARFDNLSALAHLEFVCKRASTEPEDVEDAFRLMDVYGNLGRRENATELLVALRPLGPGMAGPHRARLLFFEARECWQRQVWEEAERFLLEGRSLYESCGDLSGVGKSYVNLVGGVYGPTGQLGKAQEALERALALPRGPGQAAWRTTAAMNLGVVFWHRGRHEEAAAALRTAHREALRGRQGPQEGMIADNLCALLGEMGRFEEAARWGRRALERLSAFAVRGTLDNARYNLALAQLAEGRTAEAKSLLAQASHAGGAQAAGLTLGRAYEGLAQAAALDAEVGAVLAHGRCAMELFRELGAGRDFRYTLVLVGNLLRALGARREWASLREEPRTAAFLAEGGEDGGLESALRRLEGWGEETAEGAPHPEGSPSPEEALERRLWAAEEAESRGCTEALGAQLPGLREALSLWPYADARLRVLRLELRAQGRLSPQRRAEALRLLSRCAGGVWGVRLLCDLSGTEPSPQRARALRQRALRSLYVFHAHSPAWAWGAIAALPEARAVLKGFRPGG